VRAQLAGRFADAVKHFTAARDVAVRTQDSTAYGVTFSLIHEVQRRTGRREHVMPPVDQMVAEYWTPIAASAFGAYCLDIGDRDRAALFLERLRPIMETLPRDTRWMPVTGFTGMLAAGLGDRDLTAYCYRQLVPYDGYYFASMSGYRGSMAYTLGVLAHAVDDHDAADRHLTHAEEMERRVGAVADLALARLAHARTLAARGRSGDRRRAEALADECLRAARRLGMAPAQEQATALLADLTGVGPDSAAVLTPREREIAELVAGGLSNRTIADQLVLSERTVETHVRNVLTKLALTNRTQVAAWAVRAGLRTGSAYPH
jgi:DNA-binding CsgD family transcriptional regulator